DYVERYIEQTAETFEQLMNAQQEQWQFDPEINASRPPSEQLISRMYDLRRKATALIATIDDAFFDDLQLVLTDASLDRPRAIRAYARNTQLSHEDGHANLTDVAR